MTRLVLPWLTPIFWQRPQNSFFAAAFGVEKKTIVIKKQKGVSADDLWIAYWLTARSGADPEVSVTRAKKQRILAAGGDPVGYSCQVTGSQSC